MSTKAKLFCRISDYIEAHEGDLYELLKATCAIMNLTTKGKTGLTLLVPDAEYRKKIAELAYSADPDEFHKAGDMLNALIIRQPIKSASEWKKDNIANSLYPNQLVEVDSASGDSVKFKSGATATIDKKFADGSKKKNLAVWRLKGEIPPTTDKPAKPQLVNKKGSYMGGNDTDRDLRNAIAEHVNRLYIADMLEGVRGSDMVTTEKIGAGSGYECFKALNKKLRDAYLEHSMSLVHFIACVKKDMDLFHTILPLISFQKIDFFVLFEPYRTGRKLIDGEIIKEWASEKRSFNIQHIIDLIGKTLHANNASSKALSDRMAVLSAIDKVRQHITDPIRSNYKVAIDNAIAAYNRLVNENSIDSVTGVYPEGLHDYYAANPNLKIAHDDLRYVSSLAFDNLEKDFSVPECVDIQTNIKSCLEPSDATELLNRTAFFSDIRLRFAIPDSKYRMEFASFANSTFLLFISLSPKDMANLPFKSVKTRPYASSCIWNLHSQAMGRLKGVVLQDGGSILSQLESINESTDPAIKEAVLRAAKKISSNE